jgi:hypothetical protein
MKPYFAHREAWIVSCYYNPLRFHSRRRNLDIFYRQLRNSGVQFLVLECAFGTDDFELEPTANVLQLRARDILWQKERLLNLAARLLPASAKYVIWLDADVLFANSRWILETVAVLQKAMICQPFSRCVRLMPDQMQPDASNREIWESFAFVRNTNAEKARSGDFDSHGHTGFAWAARREIFSELGLYDRAVAGTADHLMAHAATGEIEHSCIERAFFSRTIKTHFERWGNRFAKLIENKIGFVTGDLWHLWHGELKNRRYLERTRELSRLGFNPLSDLVINQDGLFEFSETRNDLRMWMNDYFQQRLEDETALEQ